MNEIEKSGDLIPFDCFALAVVDELFCMLPCYVSSVGIGVCEGVCALGLC